MASPIQFPEELNHRLRQQLILAQVRVMELEDQRDQLAPRLADTERLLVAAQALADSSVRDAAHLEQVRADLQAQFEHQRHMQHITHLALEESRRREADLQEELAARESQLGAARLAREQECTTSRQLRELTAQLEAERQSLLNNLAEREKTLGQTRSELERAHRDGASQLERIQQLDAEQRAMKASRSWRCTRWLRSLERWARRTHS